LTKFSVGLGLTILKNDGIFALRFFFTGAGGRLPSAVFFEKEQAVSWVQQNALNGILTKYPVGIGVYEWAIKMAYFSVKRDDQKTPEFIGKFSSASLEHLHFERGIVVSDS
jgi:hypothetical protein